MTSYRERIEDAIRPLLARGYKIADIIAAPQSFGNVQVAVASDGLKLRFTSDRGQLFVDVAAPGPGGWYDLGEFLKLAGLKASAGPWESADIAVQQVERHESLIITSATDRSFTSKLVARR